MGFGDSVSHFIQSAEHDAKKAGKFGEDLFLLSPFGIGYNAVTGNNDRTINAFLDVTGDVGSLIAPNSGDPDNPNDGGIFSGIGDFIQDVKTDIDTVVQDVEIGAKIALGIAIVGGVFLAYEAFQHRQEIGSAVKSGVKTGAKYAPLLLL